MTWRGGTTVFSVMLSFLEDALPKNCSQKIIFAFDWMPEYNDGI